MTCASESVAKIAECDGLPRALLRDCLGDCGQAPQVIPLTPPPIRSDSQVLTTFTWPLTRCSQTEANRMLGPLIEITSVDYTTLE